MSLSIFPSINAFLNGVTGILLLIGYYFIRTGKRSIHKKFMIAAFSTSVTFLISYLYYHAHVGSVPFKGVGSARTIYFSILISHTILAVVIVPMAIITLSRGLASRFDRHRRIARWTLPIWLYVSVTGVAVYVMLYHLPLS
ncbi:MAG TPA: DUF420 domain-containing protein [Bacteroidota bacterium]|nr:DUF420 domain-containing protein [Bacteroidota bacterium]